MAEFNPYAPPREDVAVPVAAYRGGPLPAALEEARRVLDEYLAQPANVEADGRLMAPRSRVVTWVMLVLAGFGVVPLVAGFVVTDGGILIGVGAVLIVLFGVLFAALLAQDVRLNRGRRSSTPDAVVKGFFRALTLRPGIAVASLCPTGRALAVTPPVVPPVNLGTGTFRVSTPDEAKSYARSFCRPGDGQIRFVRVKSATVRDIRGDVAIVDVELAFQSYPQWVQIVCLIAFVTIRLVGILLIAVLYFPLRKRAVARTAKTLLRGRDGLWYLVEPSVFEAAAM
jgi:hypothetical protein